MKSTTVKGNWVTVIKKLNRMGVQPQNLPWKIIDNIQSKSIKFY